MLSLQWTDPVWSWLSPWSDPNPDKGIIFKDLGPESVPTFWTTWPVQQKMLFYLLSCQNLTNCIWYRAYFRTKAFNFTSALKSHLKIFPFFTFLTWPVSEINPDFPLLGKSIWIHNTGKKNRTRYVNACLATTQKKTNNFYLKVRFLSMNKEIAKSSAFCSFSTKSLKIMTPQIRLLGNFFYHIQ
jgi:hypothetical protein